MMTDEDKRPEIETWPPSIAAAALAQPQSADKTVHVGRLSVWLAASGVVCWVGAIAALILVDTLTSGLIYSLPILKLVYVLGIASELVGIRLGITSRKIKTGKVGLTLSVLIFAFMVTVMLVDYQQDGQGRLFWTVFRDDCGCDNPA